MDGMRTVGVEEELMLVDARTGRPRAAAGQLLAPPGTAPSWPTVSGRITGELQQEQFETNTAPCATLDELTEQVTGWRRRADDLARGAGVRVAALGTSPTEVTPTISPRERYRRMAEMFGLTTLEQLTCGCHIHVEVDSPDEGVAVIDRIQPWLPAIVALSANSPYWRGTDTGYASFRSQVWRRLPSSGPTRPFGDHRRYSERLARELATGMIMDEAGIYWDARLALEHPTVEIRVPDVCLRAEDTVTLAGLVRALVVTAVAQWRSGEPPPTPPEVEVIRLAGFRASHSGLTGDLIDPYRGVPRPATEVIAALLDHVSAGAGPDRGRLASGIETILRRGTGSSELRRLARGVDGLGLLCLAAADVTAG